MNNICLDIEEKRLHDVTDQPAKFSSSFYTDQTREVKLIREAFNSNNFTQLRELPNFKRNSLLDNSKQKVFHVIESNNNNQRIFKISGLNNYFTAFTYIPTKYEFAKFVQRLKNSKDKLKQAQISCKPFNVSMVKTKKSKFEDQFILKEKLFPFHLPEDVFDLKKQSETRQQIISECQRLAGAFKPAGKQLRQFDINYIVQTLKKIIVSDYPNSKFMIIVNKENQIEIQFHLEIIQDNCFVNFKELVYYMNSLLNDDRLSEFQLYKISNIWGFQVNEQTMNFNIRSFWIK